MDTSVNSIRYPFSIDGGAGKLAEEKDYAMHVEQLIRQVLFTSPGERINRPDFGCGIRRMVFAPNSDATASLIQVTIYQALEKWLGTLISVDSVKAKADNEYLDIRIAYKLKARQQRRFLNLEISL